ncbi:c-type cytochrome biogenesis protein CcmI [Granulibacter bethesdensis]|uniref:c-type cytochrome biogenesis protein CcmI n=1 Tax=Granulibacter bethesdensis TaxID=364410 RepID=UPI0003F2172B|nr:c-type cytochrome biogenesis protein CcmI [Granulibacter bethesdensis]AHJ67263.1 Cytochrome c-type biogenesis protein ccmI [Granulibacter bethesdensis]
MIWLFIATLALVCVAPLGWSLRENTVMLRGQREAAMALHRAQLLELDRDLAEGRIAVPEHATAIVEVQRRLLASDASIDTTPRSAARLPILGCMMLIPLAALALYWPSGQPRVPSAPYAQRMAEAQRQARNINDLVAKLRERIDSLDPHSEEARQGFLLLGTVEGRMGHMPQAVAAWRKALAVRYEPGLAARIAEADSEIAGKVTPEARTMFERALKEAPANAPWIALVKKRLQSGME